VKLNIDWLATESVGLKILRMFAELYISIQSGAAIGGLITIALFSSQITLMTFLGPIIFGIIAAVTIYVRIIKNNKKYAARIHATYTQMIKNLEAELVKARADKDEKRVSDLTKAIEEAKDILEKADEVRGETEAIKFINGVRKVYDESGLKDVDIKKLENVKDVKLVKEDYTDRLCMLFGESVKSEITDVLDKLKDGLDGVFKQNGLNPSDDNFNIDNITAYAEQLNSKATTFVKWYCAIVFGLAGGMFAVGLATLVLTNLVSLVMGGLVGLLVCLWFVYYFNKEEDL
jgi:mannitol-specific phosphotransferase system IIBC component